jgi:hypothetical protein
MNSSIHMMMTFVSHWGLEGVAAIQPGKELLM